METKVVATETEISFEGVNSEESAVTELSIDETNILRAKLGLKPLRLNGSTSNDDDGRTARTAYHRPAENTGESSLVQKRIEEAKVRRQVQKGMERLVNKAAEEKDTSSALEWATKMRMRQQQHQQQEHKTSKRETKEENNAPSEPMRDDLNVAHSLREFATNGDFNETILTLRDESILDYDEHGSFLVGVKDMSDNVLENVNLTDNQKARENLRKKRQLELGAGHAGGYAGWDDDEFDELGGFGSNETGLLHHRAVNGHLAGQLAGSRVRRLVDLVQVNPHYDASNSEGRLFASKQSVDLQTTSDVATQISSRIASDFLSLDQVEDQEHHQQLVAKEEKRRKKLLQKEKKMFKKLKKQEENPKKKMFRSANMEPDEVAVTEQEIEPEYPQMVNVSPINSLLQELEATAVDKISHRGDRKRLREDDVGAPDGKVINSAMQTEQNVHVIRRQKFDDVMEKGNIRTNQAFNANVKQPTDQLDKPITEEVAHADEEDDAILMSAISKARRLKKLKEMHTQNSDSRDMKPNNAAFELLSSLKSIDQDRGDSVMTRTEGDGGLTFEFNQTREFSHALRTKAEITKRVTSKKALSLGITFSSKKKSDADKSVFAEKDDTENSGDDHAEIEDIATASDDIPSDDEVGGFGSSANTKPLDRGLAGALSLLRSTGDITGKHAGKEDMCGRAKDERTYEDYEPLNLKEVVKIDARSANVKDLEFANREIKLDYRDQHGRLLTRKEAWRNLCYQFHGYSSSYKNEEKRMKQVTQERAERAKQNEALERGTLGALKATQKATGKAFILHKKI